MKLISDWLTYYERKSEIGLISITLTQINLILFKETKTTTPPYNNIEILKINLQLKISIGHFKRKERPSTRFLI